MSEDNKEHKPEHSHSEHTPQTSSRDEEEIKIDFSKITKPFKNLFSQKESDKKERTEKQKKWINAGIITILILIAIFLSTFYRTYPYTLPVFDEQARLQVENTYKNQIAGQIQATNPNLPREQLISQTESEYITQLRTNPELKQQIEDQSKQLAQNSKAQMQNENGQTYLLAIDPYLWYSYAKWYERTGFYGNEIVDGEKRFTLRNGRIGSIAATVTPAIPILAVHNVLKIFNPEQDIYATTFLIPVLLIGLAIIPAFFLGKKFGGKTGGFFAATIFALSASILGRTAAGFSDTDAYTFIFPFLILWLFLEAVEAKTKKSNIILSILTALAMTLFAMLWGGWWFMFDLLIVLSIVFIIYKLVVLVKDLENKKIPIKQAFSKSTTTLYFLGILIIGSVIFSALLALLVGGNAATSAVNTISAPLQPINFILGFKSAAEGVSVGSQGLNYPLWPNVFTTVAELNPGTPQQIIGQAGGTFLVILGAIGALALLFYKKDDEYYPLYGIILVIWMASTYYAGLVGVRFIALFSPVVGFGIAGLIGMLTGKQMLGAIESGVKKENKIATKTSVLLVVITVMLLILLLPINNFPQMLTTADAVAKGEIPSYDDTWNAALQTIQNSSDKAIISSWWDFGHWFEAMSERSVTFDGGDQGRRIHWIGLSLLTDDEDETLDILKMLNCGQEESYNLLIEHLKDKYETTRTIKQIIREDKNTATKTLLAKGLTQTQTDEILTYTHCDDLYDMYYITSGDMVGKAGVWGHFGSWDFDKAYMFYNLKNKPIKLALEEAQTKLGLSEAEAKKQYLEVQTLSNEQLANNWISPWPNYATGNPVNCVDNNQTVVCEYNINIGSQQGANLVLWRSIIDKKDPEKSELLIKIINPANNIELGRNPIKPNAFVIVNDKGKSKKYESDTVEFGYDILLFKDEQGTYKSLVSHPLLTESTFTKLFYMEGQGTQHFEKVFDQVAPGEGRVIVWKVNP